MQILYPSVSLNQLARLRSREMMLRFLRGLCIVLAVVPLLTAGACLLDWYIDRSRETPEWLRLLLTFGQIAMTFTVAIFFLVLPILKGPTFDQLANRVEQQVSEYGHRLVSAIQLTRPNAQIVGMSPELIDTLVREAEDISGKRNLSELANTQQLKKVCWLPLLPLAVFAGMAAFLGTNLVLILLQRQLLQDVEIPRSIQLENITQKLWPAGDEVTIQFRVRGRIDPETTGYVRFIPEGASAEEATLSFATQESDDVAIFHATIPPSTVNFSFRAWLKDGRTKDASSVVFEARPTVTELNAWLRLPDFLGLRPDGQPFEEPQAQGEIRGFEDCRVRVAIESSKPLTSAELIRVGRGKDNALTTDKPPLPMKLSEDRMKATGFFTLEAGLSAYRIRVKDDNGFEAAAPPRRGISLLPDDPPAVQLLPEYFPGAGKVGSPLTDLSGHPVLFGGPIRIAYTAMSPQGLWKARLAFRVNEGDWEYLPLSEIQETEQSGIFDMRRGAFEKSGDSDQIDFHAMFSDDPFQKPNRLSGGGRFDFQTKPLIRVDKESGEKAPIAIGDWVEYRVEVFDRRTEDEFSRKKNSKRLPGASEIRRKPIFSASDFRNWVTEVLKSEAKIRQLETKQKEVFKGG